jgi:hypothetical protein
MGGDSSTEAAVWPTVLRAVFLSIFHINSGTSQAALAAAQQQHRQRQAVQKCPQSHFEHFFPDSLAYLIPTTPDNESSI